MPTRAAVRLQGPPTEEGRLPPDARPPSAELPALEGAPSPAWEGAEGFIAWLLGGPKAEYRVPLTEKGEAKRAVLDTYTKEHSAEYQSQALIDLARRMGPKIGDLSKVESIVIHTSHHTHYVIGTGANDPQKMDPKASRETLDHSIMYIFESGRASCRERM